MTAVLLLPSNCFYSTYCPIALEMRQMLRLYHVYTTLKTQKILFAPIIIIAYKKTDNAAKYRYILLESKTIVRKTRKRKSYVNNNKKKLS